MHVCHATDTSYISLVSWLSHHASFFEKSVFVEPCDVFILLETLYRNFDFIAKRRRVYKVSLDPPYFYHATINTPDGMLGLDIP
jgi:hypothetical protein